MLLTYHSLFLYASSFLSGSFLVNDPIIRHFPSLQSILARSGFLPLLSTLQVNRHPSYLPERPSPAVVIVKVSKCSPEKQQEDTCSAGTWILASFSPLSVLCCSTRFPPQIATHKLSFSSMHIPSGTPSSTSKSTFLLEIQPFSIS